jgi:hypothetical protein
VYGFEKVSVAVVVDDPWFSFAISSYDGVREDPSYILLKTSLRSFQIESS